MRLHLRERDDDIRLASLDYLFDLSERDGGEQDIRDAILECYLDSDDRPRIRAHILNRLEQKKWSVRGYRPKIEETLPEDYALTRDGQVRRIGKQF